MNKNARIYVAGHRGLVGSAILRVLRKYGYDNIIVRTHKELDLCNAVAVADFFNAERPEYLILAAAKVGGIHANNTYPADFIYENLAIQTNVIHQAWKTGLKRLMFLGSSCIYPRDCPQPIKEEYLLTGPLEKTNDAYAIAKIAGIKMCESYNRQYDTKFLCVMPNNLYGPNDNYDLQNSHVLPALIRKFHEAKTASASFVEIWGSGKPKREFVYGDDMAEACLLLLKQPDDMIFNDIPPIFNIGSGSDSTIKELAELVRDAIGYRGKLKWNTDKPDGTPRKFLDNSRITALGWKPCVALKDGIKLAYEDFLSQVESGKFK